MLTSLPGIGSLMIRSQRNFQSSEVYALLVLVVEEPVGAARRLRIEPELLQKRHGAVHRVFLPEPAEFQHRQRDVFRRGELLEQVVKLKDETDLSAAKVGQLLGVQLLQLDALDADRSTGRFA